MRKFLLILSLLACVALSGCGSGDSNKSSSADDSIKGNVEIRDEKGSVLITTDDISSVSSGTDNSDWKIIKHLCKWFVCFQTDCKQCGSRRHSPYHWL